MAPDRTVGWSRRSDRETTFRMAKGFFTQGAAILMSRPVTLDEIEPLLGAFQIVKRDEKGVEPNLSGPSLLVAFRPEVNGYISIDLQNRPWPDHMGDPKN